MASAASSLAGADGVTLPELTLNVYTLDGFACSVVATATLTVWDLEVAEALLANPQARVRAPVREQDLVVAKRTLGGCVWRDGGDG